jgi:hypothetical protein
MKVFIVTEYDAHTSDRTERDWIFTTNDLANKAIKLLTCDDEYVYYIKELELDYFPKNLNKGSYWVLFFGSHVIGYKGANSYKYFGLDIMNYSVFDEETLDSLQAHHDAVKISEHRDVRVCLWAQTKNEAIARAEAALLEYESKNLNIIKVHFKQLLDSGHTVEEITQYLESLKK